MLATDPPDHTRLRTLVTRAFGPKALADLRPRIQALADELAERAVQRQEVDFVKEFALPLPALVISHIVGLDPELHTHFKRWTDDIVSLDAWDQLSPERAAQVQRSCEEVERYFGEVIEARRRHPGDDMLSELVQAETGGQKLTPEELLDFTVLLLLGGLETTEHLLSNTMLVLSRHPEVLPRVKADMELVPKLVEEVLRYEPPIHGIFRKAAVDVELSGVKIPAGALVLTLAGAAMRDPRLYPDPHRFSLDRDKPVNIVFGHGIHFCLGAQLARLEARLGLEALFRRIRGFTRLSEQLEWGSSLVMRGPTSLPLRLEPA
jgi:hypothetical protein